MEILFFAVVAALILGRLYQVLGQNRGAEPPPMRQPPPFGLSKSATQSVDESSIGDEEAKVTDFPVRDYDGPTEAGLKAIQSAVRGFDVSSFLAGARNAYEIIVTAYGSGDEETLRDLLSQEVFSAYQVAMDERRAANAPKIEVIRLGDSKILDAELDGKIARIDVAFSSDLADGGDGLRAADEIWTFEKSVDARDPNWLLSAVRTA
ncbi:Tim44/TimA family putative adaptor protein [Candidatus Phycosocius spiralis]|uniref:Calcium-binding protein n=1 Tax=Candidatus Phycosocius spiralis TaxID=2815099 RepID=A0ABQ4PUP1_9PROT|nr:Tim44/TimA family putative adaptor protein [Candidatus Phycosocius spiralis]GIU66688.1 calcium-binding protein [Candidatus Phycosocius spiralis]